MSPEEREELASLYVLGMLEESELASFERELVDHPELTALVAELERASTLLATSVPQHAAPNVLDRVMEQVRAPAPVAEPPPPPPATFSFAWANWIPWAIAAGLTVGCALLWNERKDLSAAIGGLEKENQSLSERVVGFDAERVRLEGRINTLENEKNKLQVRVASLEERDPLREIQPVMLAAQPGAPAGAEVMALWDPQRREGALRASKLPEPAPGKDYQLWIITPESKQPLDAGLVPAASECLPFSAAQPVNRIAALAISIEPKGGSLTPQGPVIYVGKL